MPGDDALIQGSRGPFVPGAPVFEKKILSRFTGFPDPVAHIAGRGQSGVQERSRRQIRDVPPTGDPFQVEIDRRGRAAAILEVARTHQAMLANAFGIAIGGVSVIEIGIVQQQVAELMDKGSNHRTGVGLIGDLIPLDITWGAGSADIDPRGQSPGVRPEPLGPVAGIRSGKEQAGG